MNNALLLINALLAATICLRLILYRRERGTHRPLASLLAYVLTVASGTVAMTTLLLSLLPETGQLTTALLHASRDHAQSLLNLALCVAVLTMRGNVVDLFRRRDEIVDNAITRWLRKDTWI